MLGYKKEILRRQNALETQVAELRKSVASVTREAQESTEGLVRELKAEVSNLKEALRTLDEGFKSQADALARISSAFSESTTAHTIDVVSIVEGISERIARLEERYAGFPLTVPEGNPTATPGSVPNAPAANPAPAAPKRGRGRPRKYRREEVATTAAPPAAHHTPAEA